MSIDPGAVAVPRDLPDVTALVRWAEARNVSLTPRGAGTGMPGGNVGPGVLVDMVSGHRSLGTVDRSAGTVFAQAGVTLERIDQAAREQGLFFPPLPSSAHRCTVGGVVANNAAGARSFKYGSVRDWIDSATVVLADGSTERLHASQPGPPLFCRLHANLTPNREAVLRDWPRVTKNASGYALDRFLPDGDALGLVVGSEGTLCIVTDAVLRLAPLPPCLGVVLLALPRLEDLPEVVSRARESEASACEFFGRRFIELVGNFPGVVVPPETQALVLIELEGSEAEVRDGLMDLVRAADHLGGTCATALEEEARERLWSVRRGASPAIARAAADGLVSTQFIEDSVVPPDRLPSYVRGVERILAEAGFDGVIFGHAGDGNAHVNPLVPWRDSDWRPRVRRALARTVDLVAELGGTLSGEHGDGRIRAPFLDRLWSPAAVQAFRSVKSMVDPSGRFNPGVIVPLPGQDPLHGLGARWSAVGAKAP